MTCFRLSLRSSLSEHLMKCATFDSSEFHFDSDNEKKQENNKADTAQNNFGYQGIFLF